jgi:hypothetical protein
MASVKRFPPQLALTIDATRYLYLRAGDEHRFVFVWVVMVGERVLVRSWNDKKTGWYRAFVDKKRGHIRIDNREIPVRARKVTSEKLLDAMDVAYAEKYDSRSGLKYVKGFKTKKRRAASLELLPND